LACDFVCDSDFVFQELFLGAQKSIFKILSKKPSFEADFEGSQLSTENLGYPPCLIIFV
jgi:hypothetical protein